MMRKETGLGTRTRTGTGRIIGIGVGTGTRMERRVERRESSGTYQNG